PSTCSDGESRRQNVPGCVVISIVDGAAGAGPGADGKRQLVTDNATSRAALTAGLEAVDHLELATVPGALVGEHAAECGQAHVRDRAGETAVGHHPAHVQILDAEHI